MAQDSEFREDVAEREKKAAKTVDALARQAREKEALETVHEVTFQDVLADPDNVELNVRYAEKQVEEGNLLGAAATLERVLMIAPGLHEVRLFYAAVLYRLDNLLEAEKEIQRLEDVDLPGRLRSELAVYKKQIRLRKKRTLFSIRQSLGMGYDSNRNAAPSSRRQLFSDIPLELNETNRRRSDTHFLNVTSFDVSHQLPVQAGHEVFGSFSYFQQEQTNQDPLDLHSFQFSLGTLLKTRFFNFIPSFYSNQIFLSREHYLRQHGGEFRIEKEIKRLLLFTEYRIERQDFLPITENTTGPERDGYENTVTWGGAYQLRDNMQLSGGVLYSYKSAKRDYEGYNRVGLRAAHAWLLGKGQFLLNSLDTNFDHYNEPDTAIAGRFRRDKHLRYRTTYGAPLFFFLPDAILPPGVGDVTASVSYEYFRSLSNIINYTYFNHKFQLLFTKRFEF